MRIESLLSELEIVHATRVAQTHIDDEQIDQQLYERHWALREKIDAFPASTISELAAKARAAQIELERDPDAECCGPGSYVGLTRSILNDILRIDRGAA